MLNEDDPRLQAIRDRIPENQGWLSHLDIGPGWYELVAELNENIARLEPGYSVMQVKEKFGGLRYYVDGVGKAGQALIDDAERRSYLTCEVCGSSGELRDNRSWHRTLCDAHAEAR